jgi:tetratricopeptide (TPR) repeat protein
MATGMTEQALDAFEECKKMREKDNLLHDYIIGVYGKIGHMCLEKLRANNKIDKKERNQQLKYSKKMMNKAKRLSKRHPNFKTHAILVTALYNWIIGKKKKAYKLFENSRQVAKDNSMRLALAEAYYEEGRCMLDDGGPVASRGREHIEKALMLYKECGAMVYIPRLEALLGETSIQKDA